MDDWLIMPPMYLSTDKAYNFEFDIRGNSTSYVERYEVKMSNAPTPDAMTVTLVEPTDIRTGDYIHMSLIVMPETEGIHYIGIHGISTEADGFYLYVNDVGMSAPISRRSPSAVSDISVVPGADGAYAGKEVELAIGGTIKFYTNIMFDNITLTDLNNHDLSVGLSGPARAVNQTDFTLVAKVHNLGKMASGAYTVQLKADGDLIGTAQSTGLAANATEEFEFTHRFQAIQHDMVDFTAEVLYSADEVPGNNASEPLSVQPKESLLPAVTGLSGVQAENGGVHLTWSQPDMTTGAETHTDRFEDGTAGDKTYGSWTFVDVDNVAVTGFRGVEIPGIESNKSTASFFMFDGSLPQFNETFAAHSGTKYLVSLARYDFKEVDDWAISPELSGESQSVSFFARSYDPRYLEKIEVYYSTGSKDPADFELLTDNMQVPGN